MKRATPAELQASKERLERARAGYKTLLRDRPEGVELQRLAIAALEDLQASHKQWDAIVKGDPE